MKAHELGELGRLKKEKGKPKKKEKFYFWVTETSHGKNDGASYLSRGEDEGLKLRAMGMMRR